MLKEVQDLTTPGVVKGLNTQYNVLAIQKDQSPNMMDVQVNYDGSIQKRLGSNTQNAVLISNVVGANFNPNAGNLTSGIAEFWNLNEVSGNRRGEFNSLNLVPTNMDYTGGIKNQAALFYSNSSSRLELSGTSLLLSGSATPITISTWFYLNSTGGTVDRPLVSKRSVTASAGGGITPDANDVLVANCDGSGTSFIDSSTTNTKTITANGNATQLNYKLNKSAAFFNRTTDYVIVPDSSDWDFSGQFDISFFAMINNVSVDQYFISRNGDTDFSLYYNGAGTFTAYAAGDFIQFAWTPSSNTWYYFQWQRTGANLLEFFIDGVSKGSKTVATAISSTEPVYIGKKSSAANYFGGWMKELRISNISRATTVPTTQYTTDANTVLLMHFDTPATSPLGPAIAFDGTGDYLSLADSADWDLGTGDFSVRFFFNFSTVGNCYLFNRGGVGAQDLAVQYAGGSFNCFAETSQVVAGSLTPVANKWYHLEYSRVSGTFYIFIDGRLINSASASKTISSSNSFYIGNDGAAGNHFTGYIREFILDATAGHTTAFTPSQNGETVTANTKLYIRGNENNGVTTFIDSETSAKTVTTNGDTKIKYTEDYRSCIFKDSETTAKYPYPVGSAKVDFFSAFGTGVGYFDGSGDYLSVPDDADWFLGTGDFTLETYVRFASHPSISGLIGQNQDGSNYWSFEFENTGTYMYFIFAPSGSSLSVNLGYTVPLNIWHHVSVTRSGNDFKFFINGIQQGSTQVSSNSVANNTGSFWAGRSAATSTAYLNGLMDNIRVSKGIARYTTTFNPPGGASTPSGKFEYYLYVNSSNIVQFDVSSSGLIAEGSVLATSFGAITTSTWYHAIAYHSTGTNIGLILNFAYQNTQNYTKGITGGTAQFSLGANSGDTTNFMDGRIDITGFWNRLLTSTEQSNLYNGGAGNNYVSSFNSYPWASFDFGASSIRWLTVSHGTGVYASSNLGLSWTAIATDRTANYQYLDRSKNVLIMTSEAYDRPLYWAGSVGTYAAIIGTSTPLCKYNINFNGFLILLNSNTRKRSFNYIDENLQLSSTGWLNFDIPSSADDEITAVFILRRYLYVSTRYKIFRVSYVGGNPDWQYVEVKNWGFIPRTAKKVVITNNQPGAGFYYSIGEVVVGLTYDRKIRIFDGSGDQIISNNVEKDNGLCDFSLDKISYLGSGPVVSFAEVDGNQNVYKLCVAIGQDSQQTTHFLNFDGRSMSLYPYANMQFNCMCMAESANSRFLMAFDRSGYCHMMDSGNLDSNTTRINDYFDSPFLFQKTPSQSSKGHKTDLFFSNTTSGDIYYYDRTDFSNRFDLKRKFVIGGSTHKIIHYESIDTPETYNSYQFRISSSSGNSAPWKLQRYDHFTKGLGIGRNSYDE